MTLSNPYSCVNPLGFCSVTGCTKKAEVFSHCYLGCPSRCGWMPCVDHRPEADMSVDYNCPICGKTEFEARSEEDITHTYPTRNLILENKDEIEAAALQIFPQATKAVLHSDFMMPGGDVNGMSNINVAVHLDNGPNILARIKSSILFVPFKDHAMESEVATMQVLHRLAPRLIPNAWMPSKSIAGLPLSFVERFEGEPHRGLWVKSREDNGAAIDKDDPVHKIAKDYRDDQEPSAPEYADNDTDDDDQEPPAPEYADAVIRDYAAALVQLTSVSFNTIGALTFKDAGSGSSETIFGHEVLTDSRMAAAGPQGPWVTMRDYIISKCDILLDLMDEGALTCEPLSSSIFNYLALLELKALVNDNGEFCSPQKTYITHMDAKGDHLLVSDKRLSGIIDWEFAMAFPLPLAVYTPWLSDYNRWLPYDYDNLHTPMELTPEERLLQAELVALGHPDLADAYESGMLYHVAMEILDQPRLRLVNKLRQLCLGSDHGEPVPGTIEEWARLALARYADDKRLQEYLVKPALQHYEEHHEGGVLCKLCTQTGIIA